MSYTTEIYGGLGKLFQPSPRLRSLIACGILKPGGRAPTARWNITTNGDIVLKDPHEARYTAYIASATIPMITVPREDIGTVGEGQSRRALVYRNAIKQFFGKPDRKKWDNPTGSGGFWKLLRFKDGKTGLERDLDKVKPADILTKTWPMYEGHGFLYFQNNECDHILTTEYELHEIFDKIQQWISQLQMTTRYPLTEWAPLGFGMVKLSVPEENKAPKLTRRPGPVCRYLEKYRMKMSFPTLTNNLPDMAYYYFYLELLAQALQWIVNIDGFTDNDYLGLAWLIIFQGNGIGSNSRPTEYPLNADDIFGQILDNIGDDSNEAYTFRFANPAEWETYLAYSIIKGIVMSRIDAEVHDMDYHLIAGDRLTAVESLRRIWHADYDDFGAETSPFFPPARTYVADEMQLPVIIDYKHGKEINDWTRIPPIMGDNFVKANIEHAEIIANILEPLDVATMYIEWNLAINDARRWEIMYRRHKAIIWKFRIHGYCDTLMGERGRMFQFFLAQITGTSTHFKKGYIMQTGLGIVADPGIVNVWPTIAVTGLEVEKKETSTTGKQMVAPGEVVEGQGTGITKPPGPISEEEHKEAQPTPPPTDAVTLVPGKTKSQEESEATSESETSEKKEAQAPAPT